MGLRKLKHFSFTLGIKEYYNCLLGLKLDSKPTSASDMRAAKVRIASSEFEKERRYFMRRPGRICRSDEMGTCTREMLREAVGVAGSGRPCRPV